MTDAIAKALVKPLVWQVDSVGGLFLKTPFGRYDIRRRSITGNDAFRLWGLVYGQAATEAELREIAEADHRARISAALNLDLIAGLVDAASAVVARWEDGRGNVSHQSIEALHSAITPLQGDTP